MPVSCMSLMSLMSRLILTWVPYALFFENSVQFVSLFFDFDVYIPAVIDPGGNNMTCIVIHRMPLLDCLFLGLFLGSLSLFDSLLLFLLRLICLRCFQPREHVVCSRSQPLHVDRIQKSVRHEERCGRHSRNQSLTRVFAFVSGMSM